MGPETSAPRPTPEVGPVPKGNETAPSVSSGESLQPRTVEQQPRTETRENLPAPGGGGDPTFVAPPIATSPQSAVPPAATHAKPATPTDDNPATAADNDRIEKEWVDKAKRIISSTKSDPYLQEKEISKLQADYLVKRYGKQIKIPTD